MVNFRPSLILRWMCTSMIRLLSTLKLDIVLLGIPFVKYHHLYKEPWKHVILVTNNKVVFLWDLGHRRIEKNEKANILA